MENRKILIKTIITVLTLISFTVTALVGFFYVAYNQEINRILQVGLYVKTLYLEDAPVKQLLEGAARGMVESLQDPYSVFMNEKEYKELTRYIQGSIGGIGIYVGIKDKNFVVASPIEGTPAYKAGIKREDIIIKIDGIYTSELEYDEAINMMRGEPGTQVQISIMREGVSQLLDFTLTREIIDVPSVESEMLSDRIGYLRLKVFSSNTDQAVKKQLDDLKTQGMQGLVLDLRENPGGDLDAAVNIARLFIPEGPIVYTVNKYGKTEVYATSEGPGLNMPLAVLVNGGSASASEVLSGAIKDTGSGILVGEKTFGKGIVQGVFPLARGEGLKLTTSKYLTPNKIDIHEKGIEPNIIVPADTSAKEDAQLKKAVEVVKERIK